MVVDPKSLQFIDGTELDYSREGLNEGFKFRNPKVKDECGCGESFNVATDCTTLARLADTWDTCAGARRRCTRRCSNAKSFRPVRPAPAFAVEADALERSYREIQSRVHPDRFAHAGDAERRASLQWTTRVNEAYRTLKDPVQRAKHLLELNGVDVAFETNTAMPADFLAQQMELRESLEEAKDASALDALRRNLVKDKQLLEKAIAEAIDAKRITPAPPGW